MKIIKGGICAVGEVLAGGACEDDFGVAVIVFKDSNASAVFTSNKLVAAPVTLTKEAISNGKLSAIVVNSGNANCFTGTDGMDDAMSMAKEVADTLVLDVKDVAVASTGIIGRKLPMEIITPLIKKAINNLENSNKASTYVAEAIMTTDTFSKEISVETELKNGEKVRIGGISKGSGMIAPNMGTMLSFITTDIDATPDELKIALKKAVESTFNMIVVDGDESTNDTVVLMTSGSSGGSIDENFQEALEYVCSRLALMIVKDGEGATKLIEVQLTGATTTKDAKSAAKAVVSSSLVKTAVFGSDPNWGRIVAAVGYSGADMDEKIMSICLGSDKKTVKIVDKGVVIVTEASKYLEDAEEIMKETHIKIMIDLGLGEGVATAYGCDLSYEYVSINAEYST